MAIKLEISSVHGTFSTLNTFQMSSGNCRGPVRATRQKTFILTFYAKPRFALLASLRSAIFSENEATNKLVTLLAGVNLLRFLWP